jgi:hypothetical protein
MKLFVGITTMVLLCCVTFAQTSTTGSFRKDLQLAEGLVSMTDARAIKIDGLKASYAYSFAITDMSKTHPGSSSYNLVLGAQDGKLMSMFTLSCDGVTREPVFATTGQVLGHLVRHRLGVPDDVIKSIAGDYGKLIDASINTRGATQSSNKAYGSVIVIWQNLQFTETKYKYVLYIANTTKPGTKTTCSARV